MELGYHAEEAMKYCDGTSSFIELIEAIERVEAEEWSLEDERKEEERRERHNGKVVGEAKARQPAPAAASRRGGLWSFRRWSS